jgi:protein-disulfide isomerase
MRNRFALVAFSVIAAWSQTAPSAPPKLAKTMGSAAAPITVEIFSDLGCPHCRDLHERWLTPLVRDYVNKGKVRLLLREMAFQGHDSARLGSQIACAADRIGKYGPVTDIMFREQDTWLANHNIEQFAFSVLTPAEAARVRALAKDPAVIAQVDQEIAMGTKLGINTVPAVFVIQKDKRTPVTPGSDFSLFAKYLDSLH